jgi:hypothetical protein
MIESNPHACGVDDIACSAHPKHRHAFGVDDAVISILFPILFPTWVTSAKRYRATSA